MGFTRKITCTDASQPSNAPDAPWASSVVADHYCDNKKLKFRTILKRMIRELGFACGAPPRRRRSPGKSHGEGNGHKKTNLEHNKAWLLSESGGCGAELTNADPQSVHSSFRFSFCSQVELESLSTNSPAAATVLMVNLDSGVCDSRARELKWRRIASLEKSISPVANNLIRFSYGEILSATRNFSKGKLVVWFLFKSKFCPNVFSLWFVTFFLVMGRQSIGERGQELCI